MLAINQRVLIRSVDDLPTAFDGTHGWVVRHWKRHPEFYTVVTMTGVDCVFHVSQLV